jgi:hypothetical protein
MEAFVALRLHGIKEEGPRVLFLYAVRVRIMSVAVRRISARGQAISSSCCGREQPYLGTDCSSVVGKGASRLGLEPRHLQCPGACSPVSKKYI